jgi:hypothetical protein
LILKSSCKLFASAIVLALFPIAAPSALASSPQATTTSLTIFSGGNAVASGGSVASGSMITLTASVASGTTAIKAGQVKICDASAASCADIHLLGVAQITSGGTALFRLRPGIGSHTYRATFVGTPNGVPSCAASASSPVTLTVSGTFPATASVSATGSAGNYKLTAQVAGQINAPGLPAPAGIVSFLDTSNNNLSLGTATLGPGAAVTFLNSSNPVPGLDPLGLAVGDFNHDGIPDLVVTLASAETVTILLGNGDGTFTAAPPASIADYNAQVAVVGDFNGDGNADIALLFADDAQIQILLGNGDGTFNAMPSVPISSTASGYDFATADFNGDGIADLVYGSDYGQTFTVLLGNGDGTFSAMSPTPPGAGASQAMTVGDFNGDGIPDLAAANYLGVNAAGVVSIFLGNGDGTFTLVPTTPATGFDPLGITAADFNGDGIVDLAVLNSYDGAYTPQSGTVTILLGNGDGTFTPTAASPATGFTPNFIALGDFNGDGTPDLVTANAGSNTLTVLLGNGDGTFDSPLSPAAGIGPCFLAVGDFNGDGLADVAASDCFQSPTQPNTVSVQLSQLTRTATATANGISAYGTGTHMVVASYAGNSLFGSAVSGTTGLSAVTPPSFAIAGIAVTVAPGATTGNTSTISVTPGGGFTGSIALTAAVSSSPNGAMSPPTFSFGATTPVSITGAGAGTATLAITTTPASPVCTTELTKPRQAPWYAEGGAVLACLLLGIPARRRSWRSMVGLIAVLLVFAGGAIACGSPAEKACPAIVGPPATTAGTYTITVTGTSGALTETGTVTLTVQ